MGAVILSVNNYNITAAGALLRGLLSNLAITSYIAESANGRQVFETIIREERPKIMKKVKLRNLKDIEIINHLSNKHSWVKKLYKETSAFVHFSSKHIFGITKPLNDNRGEFEMQISIGNENWPEKEIRNFLEATKTSALLIKDYFSAFADLKRLNINQSKH